MTIPQRAIHRHGADDGSRYPHTFAGTEHPGGSLERAIHAMASIVEMRDPYTSGHQNRVAAITVEMAGNLGVREERIRSLRYAALLHDLGTMFIPSEIRGKPGILNDVERSVIRMHPKYGYDVLRTVNLSWDVAEIVYQHHERLDGSGYPEGLTGDTLMLESRILAVADVVDAMLSHRPYRPALPLCSVREELTRNAGRLYDCAVVESCVRMLDSNRINHRKQDDFSRR